MSNVQEEAFEDIFTPDTQDAASEDAGAAPQAAQEETTATEATEEVNTKATEQEETEEAAEEEATEAKSHKKSGIKRLKEKTAALEEKNAAQERRIAELEARLPKPATEPPQVQPASGEPRMEDYEDVGSYLKALAKHELAVEKQQAQEQAKAQAFTNVVREAVKAHPDLPELLEDLRDIGNPVLNQAVAESEIAGDLIYHLASNPEDARRLNAMSPVAMARELGRMEALLIHQQKTAKKPAPPVSKAAPPITPVQPKAAPVARKRQEDAYVDM